MRTRSLLAALLAALALVTGACGAGDDAGNTTSPDSSLNDETPGADAPEGTPAPNADEVGPGAADTQADGGDGGDE